MSKLTLTEIWIYPIKSFGGIRIRKSQVMPKGLKFDRRWMLIDEQNRFMTQREIHKMALFQQSLVEGAIQVTFEGQSIQINENLITPESIQSVVWDDGVEVNEVSKFHSEWFSEMMKMKCRLVYFPEKNARPVDPDYSIHHEHVSLADAFPYLIIGESSLDDLNSKLQEPVPMNRFRPNFVFSGGLPYEEENWKNFSIGMNRFAGVKPCARCVMTTVDQATGEKGIEPLATLSKYRRNGNKVLFGQNVLAIDHYEIHEGDEIHLG
jgi:hypothetical protein